MNYTLEDLLRMNLPVTTMVDADGRVVLTLWDGMATEFVVTGNTVTPVGEDDGGG